MSTILALSVVVAAGWLVASLLSARQRSRSASGGSVAGFSRALGALDPAKDRVGEPAARRPGPPSRTRVSRPRSPSRPAPAPRSAESEGPGR